MSRAECNGHPAGPFDPMGETVYCDGSCRPARAVGRPALGDAKRTLRVDVPFSAAELAALDAARGDVPRAVYLRQRAIGQLRALPETTT